MPSQALTEVYTSHCAALQLKPNSWVLSYLHSLTSSGTDGATTLDFTPTFLGKRGLLALLPVFGHLPRLAEINLRATGITDLACVALCAALVAHPSVATVDLRGNVITADSLAALTKLAASMRQKHSRREGGFAIRLDAGYGIFDATVERLNADVAPAADALMVATADAAGQNAAVHREPSLFCKQVAAMRRRLDQIAALSRCAGRRLRQNADGWLVLGLVVSTPFRDFYDEMELLRHVVVPRVNRKLRRLKLALTVVDLHDSEGQGPRGADGAQFLPPFRRGRQQYEQDTGVLFNEVGATVADVRQRVVRGACDIFLGLYSDGIARVEQQVDLAALSGLAEPVPALAYHRAARGVPPGLLSRFDLKASVAAQLVAMPPQQVEERRRTLLEEHRRFFTRVSEAIAAPCTRAYNGNYSHVDADGNVHFEVSCAADGFVDALTADLFAMAATYRSRRGGHAPHSELAQESLLLAAPEPFPMLSAPGDEFEEQEEEAATTNTGDSAAKRDQRRPNVRKCVVREALAATEAYVVTIHGPPGSGRTTQLRKIAHALRTEALPVPVVLTHSVIHGERCLDAIFCSLAAQLQVAAPMMAFSSDSDELLEDFCHALTQARLTKPLCIVIDDADAPLEGDGTAGPSLVDVLTRQGAVERLRAAYPAIQFFIATHEPIAAAPADRNSATLLNIAAPTFTEHEAASLVMHHLADLGPMAQRQVRRAAQLIVMQKEHGTRPLYAVLAARELRYFTEATSMASIAEVLPGTVEALARTVMRLGLPRDMHSALVALASASAPPTGALLAMAIPRPAVMARRPKLWRAARMAEPDDGAAALLFFLQANFSHLLDGTLENGGGSVIRQQWGFASSVIRDAAAQCFASGAPVVDAVGLPKSGLAFVGVSAPAPATPVATAAAAAARGPSQTWGAVFRRLVMSAPNGLGPHLRTALAHFPDAEILRRGPSGTFALLTLGAHQELRRLLVRLSRVFDGDGVVAQHVAFVKANWRALLRHRLTLFACPQLASAAAAPHLQASLENIAEASGCARLRLRASLSFEDIVAGAAPSLPVALVESGPSSPGVLSTAVVTAQRVVPTQIFIKPSTVSCDVAVVYRSVALQRHEIVPAIVSATTHASFGYIAVIATHASSTATPIIAVHRPHKSAISCVEFAELSGGAVRIATAAYCESEICVLAPTGALGDPATSLVLVGRHRVDLVRPIFTNIGVCLAQPSDGKPLDRFDSNFCPAIAVAKNNSLLCFVEERHGGDNLRNLQTPIASREYSGHESRIELCGFSPAGAKLFSIDGSGNCLVWGAPSAMATDMALAVTQLGSMPLAAKFVDADRLLFINGRSVAMWDSATSQVTTLVDAPTRTPFQANFALFHHAPYIAPRRDLKGADATPDALMRDAQRDLLAMKERMRPTNAAHAVEGLVIVDDAQRALRVFQRVRAPLRAEDVESATPDEWRFEERRDLRAVVPPFSCDADNVGNGAVLERLAWGLHEEVSVAIDPDEGILSAFDLRDGNGQAPLFFAASSVREADYLGGAFRGPATRVFERLVSAAVCGGAKENDLAAAEERRRVVVLCADERGVVHILDFKRGSLSYPRSAASSLEFYATAKELAPIAAQ